MRFASGSGETLVARKTVLACAATCCLLPLAAEGTTGVSADDAERVEITGSRIKRVDAESTGPVQVITRDEIDRSGKRSISDVLRGVSADNNGSVPLTHVFGFSPGGVGVSLRGLGANATLVLVNGRRMAPYGHADDGQRSFVDLSSIPFDAVDRIEVLKDGASAIYGSDAIGGVINIILRTDWRGFEAAAAAGITQYGDGNSVRTSLAAGWGDIKADGWNAMVVLEAQRENSINESNRPAYLGTDNLAPWGWYDLRSGVPRQPPFFVAPSNKYGAIRDPNTGKYQRMTDCPEVDPVTDLCVSDQTQYIQAQPRVERISIFSRATWQWQPDWLAYSEFSVFGTHTKIQAGPAFAAGIWWDFRDRKPMSLMIGDDLPANHPDNPFGQPTRVRYRFADVGRFGTDTSNTIYRLVAGLKGEWQDWSIDTAAGWVQTRNPLTEHGLIRKSVLDEGLANGTYRFNRPDLVSPEFLARLSPDLTAVATSSLGFVDFKASRDLLALTGGPLAVAVGAEARHEQSRNPRQPYSYEGDIVGHGYSTYSGYESVLALFGEINAPVLKSLELNGALRTDHYNRYGTSTTPRLGVKFSPIPELALRGTLSRAFRAPGAAEGGNSEIVSFGGVVLITEGNQNIRPETARTRTLGLIAEPTRNTSASIDLYSIDRRNDIVGADTTFVVGPGQGTGVPGSTVPGMVPGSLITYDENGDVAFIVQPYINANRTRTQGFDVDLRHRIALGDAGRVEMGLTWTHISSFRRTVNGSTVEYAGTHGPYVLVSAGGTPKDRVTLDATWHGPQLSATLRANHVGSMLARDHVEDYDPNTLGDGVIPPSVSPPYNCATYGPTGSPMPRGCRVPSFYWLDLSTSAELTSHLSVTLSVQNLLDRLAPLDPYTYGGWHANATLHQAGIVGRSFELGARYRF